MFCPKQEAHIVKQFNQVADLHKYMDQLNESEPVSPRELCFLEFEHGEPFRNSGYVFASPVMVSMWITK